MWGETDGSEEGSRAAERLQQVTREWRYAVEAGNICTSSTQHNTPRRQHCSLCDGHYHYTALQTPPLLHDNTALQYRQGPMDPGLDSKVVQMLTYQRDGLLVRGGQHPPQRHSVFEAEHEVESVADEARCPVWCAIRGCL